MKDFLLLNYGIKVDKIFTNNKIKFFLTNSEKVYIVETDNIEHLKKLIDLTNNMYKRGIKVNTFILNNKNEYYVNRNNEYIALMKENEYQDVSLNGILSFRNTVNNLKKYDIITEWKNEIDNIEKELIEYKNEYKIIMNSVNYFIGMAENAIQLIYYYKENSNNTINHIIDNHFYENNLLNNPFSFINTNQMYDISNYIKYCFYNNTIDYDEIEKIIKSNDESNNIFLFSCLLYPNIYFSTIKDILLNQSEESILNNIINNKDRYISLLLDIKKMIKNVKIIDLIYWLDE